MTSEIDIMEHKETFTFYLAGELFNSKHLAGNAILGEAIYTLSNGKYIAILPQNLEQRDTTAHSIRDQDILALISCDLGLFNYDSTEIDTGTVVEYMIAKFLDIPSVILRTDFRASGDQADHAWNLMSSFYPRTEVVYLDAMSVYKNSPVLESPEIILKNKLSSKAATEGLNTVAQEVIKAFDKVLSIKPILEHRKEVFEWFKAMPGFKPELIKDIENSLKNRKAI